MKVKDLFEDAVPANPFPGSKLKKILYHGGGFAKITKPKPPFFLATEKEDCHFYAGNHDDGHILSYYVNAKKIYDLSDFEKFIEEVAVPAKVKVEIDEDSGYSLISAEMNKYSPTGDGKNPNDILYVPKIRNQLLSMGYNVVKIEDVMLADIITAYVLLDGNDAKQVGAEKYGGDDE